ncbi:hypothetical protein CEXT_744901 [Caerostris extrusa]|uniref:Uncharacterized protein n=1 Tax=Caerostris extrusa TaxID=172846 RepID=A0AAV4SW74_CAEEX|nr:hypothetical protein CEXT_744901 [Caerostris extrusa]
MPTDLGSSKCRLYEATIEECMAKCNERNIIYPLVKARNSVGPKGLQHLCFETNSFWKYSSLKVNDVYFEVLQISIQAVYVDRYPTNHPSQGDAPKDAQVFRSHCLLCLLPVPGVVIHGSLLKYPVIVDVYASNPSSITLPAFTVCEYNGIKRSKFCRSYPHLCTPKNPTKISVKPIQLCV